MAENKEIEDQEYIDQFNAGYLIGKHSPELADLIDHMRSDNLKLMAIKDGIGEYASEKELNLEKERMPSWLKEDPFKQNLDVIGPSKDIDKDIDVEPVI